MLLDLDELNDANVLELVMEDHATREQRKINLYTLASSLSASPSFWKPSQWKCTRETAQLVHAASLCCKAVYRKDRDQLDVNHMPGYAIKQQSWTLPSRDGTVKASALFELERVESTAEATTLVAAVRGSASMADWLVNMDKEPGPYPELLDIVSDPKQPLLVHQGFGKGARALAPVFTEQLTSFLKGSDGRDIELIFTGHSAGGAVAALLFSQFLTSQHLGTWPTNVRASCITFGAPPSFSTEVTRILERHVNQAVRPGLMLAFAVEGDPVPRMDAEYSKELVRLYHEASGSRYPAPSKGDGNFKPPPLLLHRLGQLVMLSDAAQLSDEVDLTAWILTEDNLSRRLWANLFAHKMTQYLDWTAMLAEGCFNGRGGWTD